MTLYCHTVLSRQRWVVNRLEVMSGLSYFSNILCFCLLHSIGSLGVALRLWSCVFYMTRGFGGQLKDNSYIFLFLSRDIKSLNGHSLIGLLTNLRGGMVKTVATSVCLSLCLSVTIWNTLFLRLWRLLVERRIINIGVRWYNIWNAP